MCIWFNMQITSPGSPGPGGVSDFKSASNACFQLLLTWFYTPQEWTDFKSEFPTALAFCKHFLATLLYLNPNQVMGTLLLPPADRLQNEDGIKSPEIRLKCLNPSSLRLLPSHQERRLPLAAAAAAAAGAAAMWEELPASEGCPHPAEAESPSLQPSPLPPVFTHEDEKMTITSRQSFNVLTVIFLLLSTAGWSRPRCGYCLLRLSKLLTAAAPPLFREKLKCRLLLYTLDTPNLLES